MLHSILFHLLFLFQDFMAKEKMKINTEFEHVKALMDNYHNGTDEQVRVRPDRGDETFTIGFQI